MTDCAYNITNGESGLDTCLLAGGGITARDEARFGDEPGTGPVYVYAPGKGSTIVGGVLSLTFGVPTCRVPKTTRSPPTSHSSLARDALPSWTLPCACQAWSVCGDSFRHSSPEVPETAIISDNPGASALTSTRLLAHKPPANVCLLERNPVDSAWIGHKGAHVIGYGRLCSTQRNHVTAELLMTAQDRIKAAREVIGFAVVFHR